jgi:HAD superfamily hydrolase (TIGR01490 family)
MVEFSIIVQLVFYIGRRFNNTVATKKVWMKIVAALFDCDGTLFTAQFGRGLLGYANDHGRKGAAWSYYASIFFPYMLGKFGLLGKEKSHRPLILHMPKLIRGLSEREAEKEFDWILQNYLLPTQRKDVVTRLRDHQAQDYMIVLISGILAPALARIAQIFGATGFVGTRVEVHNGQYTGHIIPPVITGGDKECFTRKFFSSRDIEVDWEASYAYADSMTDKGLLEMVGNPVAVYPDSKLQAYAQANHWEVLGTPKT